MRTNLLGEDEVELLNLAELVLHKQETLLAGVRGGEELLPAANDVLVASHDVRGLVVLGLDQLVLQRRDVLDPFQLERVQT